VRQLIAIDPEGGGDNQREQDLHHARCRRLADIHQKAGDTPGIGRQQFGKITLNMQQLRPPIADGAADQRKPGKPGGRCLGQACQ
jgi:hypothetical protein